MTRLFPILITLSLILSPALFASEAQAADCKGRSRTQCSSTAQCNWVNPYTRKDGAKVKGHCRKNAAAKSSISDSRKDARKKGGEKKKLDKGDRGRSAPKGKAKGHDKTKSHGKSKSKDADKNEKTKKSVDKSKKKKKKKAGAAKKKNKKSAKKKSSKKESQRD